MRMRHGLRRFLSSWLQFASGLRFYEIETEKVDKIGDVYVFMEYTTLLGSLCERLSPAVAPNWSMSRGI